LESFEDQMYVNLVLAKALGARVGTLSRLAFPNGAFRIGRHFDPAAAAMMHFNFNRGNDKRLQMAEAGVWFLNASGNSAV